MPQGFDAAPIWRSYSGGELWIGSYPTDRDGPAQAGFDVLVLSAGELQGPEGYHRSVNVVRCRLSDVEPMRDGDLDIATECALGVARMVAQGRKVLVTCHKGLNRSALICGIVLQVITTMSGLSSVSRIRATRPGALGNRAFEQAVVNYRMLHAR